MSEGSCDRAYPRKPSRRLPWLFAAGLAAILMGFLVGRQWVVANAAPAPAPPLVRGEAPSSQLLMILYVSSTCSWCNQEELPDIVEGIRRGLRQAAENSSRAFVTLGVSVDQSPDVGIEYLKRFGSFHQVAAGNAWGNVAAIDFRGLPTIDATPQVVVVERTLGGWADDGTVLSVRDARILARKMGFYELQQWAAEGAPVATD